MSDKNEEFDRVVHEALRGQDFTESSVNSEPSLSSGERANSVSSEERVVLDSVLEIPNSEQISIIQLPISIEGELNDVSSDTHKNSDVVVGETESDSSEGVLVDHISQEIGGSGTEIGPTPDTSDRVDSDNGILVSMDGSEEDSPKGHDFGENEGKEDTFVEASDQLNVYDGRSSDLGESMVMIETRESMRDKVDIQDNFSSFSENLQSEGINQIQQLMAELTQAREDLNKSLTEKERMQCELKAYKEERFEFSSELANLHQQLKSLNIQQSQFGHSSCDTEGVNDDKSISTVMSFPVMFEDCSKFVSSLKISLEEHFAYDMELGVTISSKDEEIEDLNRKITEHSLSQDIVISYLDTLQRTWNKSSNEYFNDRSKEDNHLRFLIDRMLDSLSPIVLQDFIPLNDSITERFSKVERCTTSLIEKHLKLHSELGYLKNCLTELNGSLPMPEETELDIVLKLACEQLLEQKGKESDMLEKLKDFEKEKEKLLELLNQEKQKLEENNMEISKTKTELEQAEGKLSTAREKLSMAVTKGKALVQQRDSLRQSLQEKTTELERCLSELQQKSNALEVYEINSEELKKSQNLVSSLQDDLLQKSKILEEIDEIVSQVDVPQDIQVENAIERIRNIVIQKNTLEKISMEYDKLKDSLSSIVLPETCSSEDLGFKINWLQNSFSEAQDEIVKFKKKIVSIQEASTSRDVKLDNEINNLNASLSVAKHENEHLKAQLEILCEKYDDAVKKESCASSEKDELAKILLDACGKSIDDLDICQPYENGIVIEKCINILKETINLTSISCICATENYQKLLSFLYVKEQELMLCEKVLEEEVLHKTKIRDLSSELNILSEKIVLLESERDSIQKDLEQSEEKSSMLREKLSLAVKKGKGLVQEREGLKHSLNQKNNEIEMLQNKLAEKESSVSKCNEQIKILLDELEQIPQLMANIELVKEENDQMKRLLVDSVSNEKLRSVIDSLDVKFLPKDCLCKEPIEKVKWLLQSFHELQLSNMNYVQDLEKIKEEFVLKANEVSEAYSTIKSLEEKLMEAERKASVLLNEKKEIEAGKSKVERDLEKAREESDSWFSKLENANVRIKSLENSLSVAEMSASVLFSEKEIAEATGINAKQEIEKIKAEANLQASKLEDAYINLKSLEDALSQSISNVSILENEKIEMEVQNKQKIMNLSSQLNECKEKLESLSSTLLDHNRSLQLLVQDRTLSFSVTESLKSNFSGLRRISLLIQNIQDNFAHKGSEWFQLPPEDEKTSKLINLPSSPKFETYVSSTAIFNEDYEEINADNITANLNKLMEELEVQNKFFTSQLASFSSSMDGHITNAGEALQTVRDNVNYLLGQMESLKFNIKNLEVYEEDKHTQMIKLQKDTEIFLLLCKHVTQQLQNELRRSIDQSAIHRELENLHLEGRDNDSDIFLKLEDFSSNECSNVAEELLEVIKGSVIQLLQLENSKNLWLTSIKDLENKLQESTTKSEKAIYDMNLKERQILELEQELLNLKNAHDKIIIELQQSKSKENITGKHQESLTSLYDVSTGPEIDEPILSKSQVEELTDKINKLEIPFIHSEFGSTGTHLSDTATKFFYIVDNFVEFQKSNIELGLSIEAQRHEIEHLKKEAEYSSIMREELEKKKNDISDITLSLDRIIHKIGGYNSYEDGKSNDFKGLLFILEKLALTLTLELETSRSKVQEYGTKLQGNRKLIDELSAKVKLFEDSVHNRLSPPDVEKRKIFEPSSGEMSSEILEIEDAGSLGKNSAPSILARTMRKGSTEHLVLNVDVESDRLISQHEIDDKGHIFKSLNTTGFIPKQGKMVADRVDGIWASGSRMLMKRPRARIGLIAYWFLLHIWVLATIL